jgi:hypothetical protein
MRALSLLAVVLMLIGLGAFAVPHPADAAPAAHAADINLGGLLGDENEADEDEPDEGGPEGGQATSSQSSNPSPLVVLLVVAAVAIVAAFVVSRVRRFWRRLRAWAGGP